jgi:cytochrome P450
MSERPTVAYDPHDPGMINNPFDFYDEAREKCPVFHSTKYDGFWSIMRYDDVKEAVSLDDGKTFSSAVPGITAFPLAFRRTFPYMPQEFDAPEHRQYRGLITHFFGKSRVAKMEDDIRQVARELLETMSRETRPDLVQHFAVPFVGQNLMALLGLPRDDFAMLSSSATDIFHGRLDDPERAKAGSATLIQYIERVIEDRRQSPRSDDDFFTFLTRAEVFDRPLTHQEILGCGTLMINAGLETTVNGVGNSLWYIAHDRELRHRLQAEEKLLPKAIEEFLRYLSPLQLFGRSASRDVEFRGCAISAGEIVTTNFGSANRDESTFERADEYIPDRSPNRHVAFGCGPHFCLGAHFARLEMSVAIQEVLGHFPDYELDPEREVVMHPHGDLRGYWSLPAVLNGRRDARETA